MVPAFLFLGIVASASCLFCVIASCDSPYGTWKNTFATMAVISGLTLATAFALAGGLNQKHWNDTCHRMGGRLFGSDKGTCVVGPVHVLHP